MKPDIQIILQPFFITARRQQLWPLDDYAEDVGKRLCPADAVEAALATGRPAEEAPLRCLAETARSGGVAAACLINGRAEMLWGVRRKGLLTSEGEIWMLRTQEPEKYPLRFARESRRHLAGMVSLSELSTFENIVHVENAAAIRWLQWLGFTFDRHVGTDWLHFTATAHELLARNLKEEPDHGSGC